MSAAILLALLPSTVSADRVSKGSDHYVFAGCDAPIDGGFVSTFFELSTGGEFEFVGLNVWLDPDLPFESDPTVWGSTDAFDLADDGTTIDVEASFPTFDIDGIPKEMPISRSRSLGPETMHLIVPDAGKTNYNSRTSGMEEGLGRQRDPHVGWIRDPVARVLRRCWRRGFLPFNPRAFVSSNAGVQVDCTPGRRSRRKRVFCD